MLSAIHRSFGEPADQLEPAEMPVPVPGAGQVRIRTILTPIHNHDLWTVRGNYGYRPELPAIGGSEAVGIVEALGEGADPGLIGTRVAVAGVRGSWAEFFLAPATALLPLPDAIADEAAAQLIAMPFSAIALLESLAVTQGDWVVQNAANGAVGKTLAMLARARGVEVLSLVRRDAGVAELEAQGIGNAVSTADPGWRDRARALLGTGLARAAIDSIGGDATEDLAQLLGERGLLVSFGSMTGEPMRISSGTVIFKQLTLRGFWGAKLGDVLSPEDRRRMLTELVTRVARGELMLPVDGIYPLGEIKAAVTASLTPGKTGKVLLRP